MPFYIQHPPSLFLLEQVSCQTIDVSSEAWLICQDAVEPSKMFAYCIAYRSHIDHGEEGTDAYDVPLPSTEEDITEYDQGAIHTYLP